MQFFILLVGVMVFVFYQFNASPLNFNPAATKAVKNSTQAPAYVNLEQKHQEISLEKKELQFEVAARPDDQDIKNQIKSLNNQETQNREQAKELILKADPDQEVNDKDYVFIHFILNNLPRGLIGLLLLLWI